MCIRLFIIAGCLLLTIPLAAEDHYEASCEIVRGRLLAPVQINDGGPYPFLLDAGLRQPVLTPDAIEYLGLPPGKMPDYPGVTVAEVDAFAPAGLPAQPAILLVAPVPNIPERLGYRVAGLLPLHQPGYEITLQVAEGIVKWRTLGEAALDKTAVTAIPLRIADNGQPQVQALFNGEYLAPVQIDLNFGDTLALPAAIAAQLAPASALRLHTRLDGGQTHEQLRLDSITIGNAKLQKPVCTVVSDASSARVGLAFLRHFTATFNLEYGRLHLDHPGADAPADPPVEGFGVSLARQVGGFWTVHVADESPAAEAGVLPGDQLAAIAGQSLENVGYEGAMRLLDAPAGAGISLTWRRGFEEQTAELVARPLL